MFFSLWVNLLTQRIIVGLNHNLPFLSPAVRAVLKKREYGSKYTQNNFITAVRAMNEFCLKPRYVGSPNIYYLIYKMLFGYQQCPAKEVEISAEMSGADHSLGTHSTMTISKHAFIIS